MDDHIKLIKIFPYHKRTHVEPLKKRGVGRGRERERKISGFTKAIESNHHKNIELKKNQNERK